MGIVAVTGVTFAFAYLFGFALTIGPLMQDGVGFKEAVADALWSETPSITIMEIAAVGTDLLLASEAAITDVLFWLALAFSLSIGFLVAWPVNIGLIEFGVKEGMSDPSEMDGRPRRTKSVTFPSAVISGWPELETSSLDLTLSLFAPQKVRSLEYSLRRSIIL